MIKTTIRALTLVGLLTATAVFADAKSTSNGYYNVPYTKSFAHTLVPATNISVLNYSDDTVYAIVPGLGVTLFSGNATTFRLDNFYGETYMTLQDPWQRPFFTQYVCRRAIVIVDGRPGAYRINVDRRYC